MGLFDFLGRLLGSGNGDGDATADRADDDDGVRIEEMDPADFEEAAEEFSEDHSDDDTEFDFSVESLEDLDDFAEGQAKILDVMADEAGRGSDLFTGLAGQYVLLWGSYLGEVLVREFDGEWELRDQWVVTVDGETVRVFEVAGGAASGTRSFTTVVEGL